MSKKTLFNIGLGMLICLTGCSSSPAAESTKETAKTEEKTDSKAVEKEKEKLHMMYFWMQSRKIRNGHHGVLKLQIRIIDRISKNRMEGIQ